MKLLHAFPIKTLSTVLLGAISLSAQAVVYQAENYNAFYDTTPGNSGGAYRGDAVDIEAASDSGGGYNVGWIDATEWLVYGNLSIPTSGNYTIRMRVASPNSGTSASLDLNSGAIVLGTVNIPNTGGWQNWQTVSINANINAGTYNLGVYARNAGWNFNWIEVVPGTTQPTSGVVKTYQHCDYGGWSAGLDVGNYTAAALQARGFVNNDASSLRVTPGYEAVLYTDDNFLGSSTTVRSDESCLVNRGFNDVVTSIIVRPVTGVAKAYQHCDYGGWATNLDVGNYNLAALQARGFINNDASSIKVGAGYEAVLYKDDNFSGASTIVSGDTNCLVSRGFNDNVSSLIIRKASTTTGGDSIASIPASSIPMPPANGSLSIKVMNGTNGVKSSNQIYWGVIGINPGTGRWSYLDLNGNLIPISLGLNDAPGHLTKNGANYANIYHTVSQTNWANLPKITSGRMFICVDSPCYIKTYDNGFAGPNIDNPTDPNRDIYFDFIEFTVDGSGYHGNTTRVDGFGFPLQMRLVNQAGNYDRTVGELESETRAGIFSKYQNEVPNEFKSLGRVQSPYRIVAPLHGSFAPGGENQYYFANYAPYSNRDILGGENDLAQNPQLDAAINRHVYNDSANWNNPAAYYKAGPANYYAKFWHDHGIDRLAYGFPYDDVNEQASYLEVGAAKGLIVRVGW